MRKPNLLEKEGKERGNKWVVYCVIIVGVLIGAGIFVYSFSLLNVPGYIHDTKQIPTLNEFYEKFNASDNTTSVLFIGNSVVGFSVYPPEINRILVERGYNNVSVYNLQLSGGDYCEYILQLDKIININPDLIVIGTSYVSLHGNSSISPTNDFTKERYELFYNISDIRPGTESFYSEEAINYISYSPDYMYYKKYIRNSLLNIINLDLHYTNDYFTDPIGYDYRIEFDKSAIDDKGIQYDVVRNSDWHGDVTDTINSGGKLSLNYLINELTQSGINTVCINLPLHPSHSKLVTESSRTNLHNYLNNTGVPWYDYEKGWDKDMFRDQAHMSFKGAMSIANKYADLIIQEVNKNAVHNS